MATTRLQPALAPLILIGNAHTVYPVSGSAVSYTHLKTRGWMFYPMEADFECNQYENSADNIGRGRFAG